MTCNSNNSYKTGGYNLRIMALSPQVLLSNVARERCIYKLKELPIMFNKKVKVRQASVLVPICVENGEVCLLYTLRSSNLKQHSGQVSFPGGKADDNETVAETATRETEEEIGVPRETIEVWGTMPQVQGRNKKIAITPVVGLIKNFDMQKLKPSAGEVEEIFKVSMAEFCNPANHGHVKYEHYTLPLFITQKHIIWGITGLITQLFLQCFLPENVYQLEPSNRQYTIDELLGMASSKL